MIPAFETTTSMLALVALLSYLLGSVSFGLVIARLMGLGNLREIGSGNIGATNVLRTGNKLAAFLTLVLDAGKGAIAVLIARALIGPETALLAGVFAFLGHLYPVWLRFQGGKGVATFLGTVLAIHFPAGLLACATWLIVAAGLRYSSLSALVASALTPVYLWYLGQGSAALFAVLLALLIFWRHRANIARLAAGTEPKIGKKG